MLLRRALAVLIAVSLGILVFSFVGAEQQPAVRVASLKGPTSMGLARMMETAASGAYTFTVSGTADEIVPLLAKGELDIALVPCNLASVLYQKLNGGVSVAAINTLGVLYIVEQGDSVQSMEDLKGKTLYSTGKGTTPEYALNAVLKQNGIDPERDLTVEFKAEATEVAAALSANQASLAMLPQPYVTAVLAQNPSLRVALSLTDEWAKVMPDSALVTGVVLMTRDFIENHPDSVSAFMEAYRESTAYVNEHPAEIAPKIEELGIAKAAIAEKAIPACNIVCIEGDEMRAAISGYLVKLYEQDPTSIGGTLPDEAFYYIAK